MNLKAGGIGSNNMIKLFRPLQKLLNIKIQKFQGWLILSCSLSGLIYTYVHPVILKATISNLPEQYISVEAMWFCLTGLILGAIWKGATREKAIKYFTYIAVIESLCAFTLGCFMAFVHYNVWVFAIASALYLSVISQFIGKCTMMFKSRLWLEKEREDFDNTSVVIGNIVALSGFAVATFAMPSLKLAVFLWGCGCIIDDLGWIIVYSKTRSKIIDKI